MSARSASAESELELGRRAFPRYRVNAQAIWSADHPFTMALRLLGRDLMDLVEKCFDTNTALPRALQKTLSGEEIAAIRVWQAWALERHGGPSDDEAMPLVDSDLPRSSEEC